MEHQMLQHQTAAAHEQHYFTPAPNSVFLSTHQDSLRSQRQAVAPSEPDAESTATKERLAAERAAAARERLAHAAQVRAIQKAHLQSKAQDFNAWLVQAPLTSSAASDMLSTESASLQLKSELLTKLSTFPPKAPQITCACKCLRSHLIALVPESQQALAHKRTEAEQLNCDYLAWVLNCLKPAARPAFYNTCLTSITALESLTRAQLEQQEQAADQYAPLTLRTWAQQFTGAPETQLVRNWDLAALSHFECCDYELPAQPKAYDVKRTCLALGERAQCVTLEAQQAINDLSLCVTRLQPRYLGGTLPKINALFKRDGAGFIQGLAELGCTLPQRYPLVKLLRPEITSPDPTDPTKQEEQINAYLKSTELKLKGKLRKQAERNDAQFQQELEQKAALASVSAPEPQDHDEHSAPAASGQPANRVSAAASGARPATNANPLSARPATNAAPLSARPATNANPLSARPATNANQLSARANQLSARANQLSARPTTNAAPLSARPATNADPLSARPATNADPLSARPATNAAPLSAHPATNANPLSARLATNAAPLSARPATNAAPLSARPATNAAPLSARPATNAAPLSARPTTNAAPLSARPATNAAPLSARPTTNAAPLSAHPATNAAPLSARPATNAAPLSAHPRIEPEQPDFDPSDEDYEAEEADLSDRSRDDPDLPQADFDLSDEDAEDVDPSDRSWDDPDQPEEDFDSSDEDAEDDDLSDRAWDDPDQPEADCDSSDEDDEFDDLSARSWDEPEPSESSFAPSDNAYKGVALSERSWFGPELPQARLEPGYKAESAANSSHFTHRAPPISTKQYYQQSIDNERGRLGPQASSVLNRPVSARSAQLSAVPGQAQLDGDMKLAGTSPADTKPKTWLSQGRSKVMDLIERYTKHN